MLRSSTTRLRKYVHTVTYFGIRTTGDCGALATTKTSVFVRRFHKIAKSDYQLRHVCLSVHKEQLGSHKMDFHEILYVKIFRKSVDKISVLLKYDENNEYFT